MFRTWWKKSNKNYKTGKKIADVHIKREHNNLKKNN